MLVFFFFFAFNLGVVTPTTQLAGSCVLNLKRNLFSFSEEFLRHLINQLLLYVCASSKKTSMCSYKSKKRKNFVSPLSDGHLNGVAVERRRKQNRHDHYHIITYINTNISNFVLYICSLFKPKFTLLLFLWRGKRLSYSEQFKK